MTRLYIYVQRFEPRGGKKEKKEVNKHTRVEHADTRRISMCTYWSDVDDGWLFGLLDFALRSVGNQML